MARMPASIAPGGDAKGLSPISSSMTSLPPAISRLATASTLNAVSTPTEEANRLNAGMGGDCTRDAERRLGTRSGSLAGLRATNDSRLDGIRDPLLRPIAIDHGNP